MVIRVSDKTQNYSKVTKLLVKPLFNYIILFGAYYESRYFKTAYSRSKGMYLYNPIISRNYDLEDNVNYCFVGVEERVNRI